MKLLQAMAGASYGGAEAFFVRLAQALAKTDLEQEVLIRDHPARAQALRDAGVPVKQAAFGGKLDFATKSQFKKAIRTFGPDIVLTWMNRATSFCPKGDFVQVARLGGYYDLKYYQHCDHLIGNTQDIVRYLVEKGWPEDKAHYLPNFVTEAQMAPVDRKPLYTPDNLPLLLACGRLHENKGFDTLLKAIARAPDTYLWIAGDGPLRAELEEQAKALGVKPRVRFLGWREDVPALLATCDVFICPSRHEPLGNVVLEAWAQKKPVIAADSLGPGTLIEQDVNGILVPVDDDREMGLAIKWLTSEPLAMERLAEAGRRSFETDYTEEAVVAQYLDFFEKIKG